MKKKALLKVASVRGGSLADTAGIVPGDLLLTINGQPIGDIIDFYFYSAEELLDLELTRNASPFQVTLTRSYGDDIGLEFEPMQYRHCGNHCVFCFVDQNPKQLRSTLYFKDEDFRLSFLYGNYVTMTNIGDAELNRIVEQRLSPLYVSVHAVQPHVRKKMLGLKKDDHLLEKIEYLVGHGIQLHGQIVLCPGWNDESVLDETIAALIRFFPGFRTLAVVPLGLTKHRKGLTALNAVTPAVAGRVIEQVQVLQQQFEKEHEEPFVYLADEFYLRAGADLPDANHYREYWQIENGVGLTRDFLDQFDEAMGFAPDRFEKPVHHTYATGQLAAPVLKKHVMPRLNKIENLTAELCAVENTMMGNCVTVSGLLGGRDFFEALNPVKPDTHVLLPPNCVNEDGLFLDDWTVDQLSKNLKCPVHVVNSIDDVWNIK